MANGWTQERRERQSAAIARWRPWESSTGPQTAQGKGKASRNAYEGGRREKLCSELAYFRELLAQIETEAEC